MNKYVFYRNLFKYQYYLKEGLVFGEESYRFTSNLNYYHHTELLDMREFSLEILADIYLWYSKYSNHKCFKDLKGKFVAYKTGQGYWFKKEGMDDLREFIQQVNQIKDVVYEVLPLLGFDPIDLEEVFDE